jgi:hypothetical protein
MRIVAALKGPFAMTMTFRMPAVMAILAVLR